MKVWVMIRCNWDSDQYWIGGVYESEELAKKAAEREKLSILSYDIEELEVEAGEC